MADEFFFAAFERAAREHPECVALEEIAGRRLSYRELHAEALGLAGALAEAGIHSGDLVAIDVPKSADTVIAELAVWAVGAAWLPVDPTWPAARRAHILKSAGARLVLHPDGEKALAGGIPVLSPRARTSAVPASHDARREELAYVIYTSGSTGAPKGVLVSHAGLCAVLRAQIAAFGLSPGKRALFVLAPSFDAALSDVGTALLSGATLVIPGRAPAPELVREWLVAQRITHVDLPPAFLPRISCAELGDTLEVVVIGGEVAPADAVRSWARRVRVINAYGPTEATICTSLCVCDGAWSRPSLGEPIAGMSYEVVDESLSRVSEGTPGELCIRGPGLALGYVNDPALTARKFVELCGARWYRTGDRVVRHADGAFEFLGRVDRQLKHLGRLIEPAEIEAQLVAHPEIQRAFVTLQARPGHAIGAHRAELCAFVASTSAALTSARIDAYLSERIPRWMCPTRIVVLPELPETTSGKIAGASLALWTDPESSGEPSDLLERELAEIWRVVLRRDLIERRDDFFALGGDSLLALEVVVRAEACGVALSTEALYRHRTLAALAEHARSKETCDTVTTDELRADAERIASEIVRPGSTLQPSVVNGAVLLTGATGFLGARLLSELLRSSADQVVCLVRAASEREGRARISGALAVQSLALSEREQQRLRIVTGDLCSPELGREREAWRALTAEVSRVYHAAAAVHLALPYEALRAQNVSGTARVLEFVQTGRPKHLHYVSTLSVGACIEPLPARFSEADSLDGAARVFGGYAQSKWAAEYLVRHWAARTNAACAIYRLGLLTGDSRGGRASSHCQLTALLRGLVTVGAVPATLARNARRLRCDITPVDSAATAIYALSRGERRGVETFHVCAPRATSLDELLCVVRALGYELPQLADDDFRARLAALAGAPTVAHAMISAWHRLFETSARHRMADLFLATDTELAAQHTRAELEQCAVRTEPDRAELLTTLVSAMSLDGVPRASVRGAMEQSP